MARILGEDGKFREYKGPKAEKKIYKSIEQKVAEQKAQEGSSVKEAVKDEIISLTDDEKSQIKAGLSMPEMKALAKRANIEIPKGTKSKKDLVKVLLSEEDDLGL